MEGSAVSEELLVRYCSPTLAGIKTGNIFSCPFSDYGEIVRSIRFFNRLLRGKGLCVIPLRRRESRVLVYVCRPSRLKKDLNGIKAGKILENFGYRPECTGGCVSRLIKRLKEENGFPHEIGLFLGYPPEDVIGFIENNAERCKCTGCWKVYGDEEKAKRLFAKYEKCTEVYCGLLEKGKSIERLTVVG